MMAEALDAIPPLRNGRRGRPRRRPNKLHADAASLIILNQIKRFCQALLGGRRRSGRDRPTATKAAHAMQHKQEPAHYPIRSCIGLAYRRPEWKR
jgi:hypothetical protein